MKASTLDIKLTHLCPANFSLFFGFTTLSKDREKREKSCNKTTDFSYKSSRIMGRWGCKRSTAIPGRNGFSCWDAPQGTQVTSRVWAGAHPALAGRGHKQQLAPQEHSAAQHLPQGLLIRAGLCSGAGTDAVLQGFHALFPCHKSKAAP